MKITLLGDLKRFAPGNAEDFEMDLAPGTTIDALLKHLAIDPEIRKIVLVNGRPAQKEQPLSPSDHVTLLPAVEGG